MRVVALPIAFVTLLLSIRVLLVFPSAAYSSSSFMTCLFAEFLLAVYPVAIVVRGFR